jgi:hypothetical protein
MGWTRPVIKAAKWLLTLAGVAIFVVAASIWKALTAAARFAWQFRAVRWLGQMAVKFASRPMVRRELLRFGNVFAQLLVMSLVWGLDSWLGTYVERLPVVVMLVLQNFVLFTLTVIVSLVLSYFSLLPLTVLRVRSSCVLRFAFVLFGVVGVEC